MTNDIAFFLGFILINLVFLFLFPFYIGLNASSNLRKSFKFIEIGKFVSLSDRFIIALFSVGVFAVVLFVLRNGEVAIVLGFLISASFVALDYKRIYSGNRDPDDEAR